MIETIQLKVAPVAELHDAPKLLVEWTSRWDEFVTSIDPAFARSAPRLAGEAPLGASPYKGMAAALLLESLLLLTIAILPREIARLRPYAAPRLRPDEVIYYSGDELPRVEDLGGSSSGAAGHAGGQETRHRTQTIRVARGSSLAAKIIDAPALKLPSSVGAVANLLALKSNPAPLPVEGLRSSLRTSNLPANVVSPAPVELASNHSRGGITFDAVVPPAPRISSARSRAAPSLNSEIVAPAPNVRSEHSRTMASLHSTIIAPAPDVSRERTRSTPALNARVVPPAPAIAREVAPTRVQMNNVVVVPPPVSAPERESGRNAKVNLPAPSIIAPPPSSDSTRDLRRLESGSSASSPAVIPPPQTQAANGSIISSIVGKLFGTQDVVPPPPTVSSSGRGTSATQLAANVVPPPPFPSGSASGGSGTSRRTPLGTNIVPPPPSLSSSGSGGSSGNRFGSVGANGLGSNNNVVPPPAAGAGDGLSGSGRKGSGLGAPGDIGSALAPPKGAAGSRDNSGVVLSAQPGSNVGAGNGAKGSLAMSPTGGDIPGLGGSGGRASIGRGDGPGSGLTGETSGAGKTGTGHGSDPGSHAGISPTPGPGGAGSSPTGSPVVPGVDVRGGSTVVNLPSFASDGGSGPPSVPGRTSIKGQQGPAITIVATSRSGGAFDFYGKLPGDNYTVYVDTAIGTVVMQFAEADLNAARSHPGTLTGPESIRTDLPSHLPRARVVIKCKLDASGNVRNPQVLEAGPAAMTAKIVAALPSWKFRPATRGARPVEVNAILGFNIDTNDRY